MGILLLITFGCINTPEKTISYTNSGQDLFGCNLYNYTVEGKSLSCLVCNSHADSQTMSCNWEKYKEVK